MIDMKLKTILAFLFFSFLLSQPASALTNINSCRIWLKERFLLKPALLEKVFIIR